MIRRPLEIHGAEFDLVVAGGSLFACAVARDAAVSGLRTLVVAPDDLGAEGRPRGWLAACLADDAADAVVATALAEREWLLRHAPHLARPLRAIVATCGEQAGVAMRRLRRLAAHAPRSTLPPPAPCDELVVARAWPQLGREAAASAALAFDALLDEAGLARTLARDAIAAGATVWTHAVIERAGIGGVELHSRRFGVRARVRAATTLATEAFADVASAFHVDPGDRLATATACYVEVPATSFDLARVALGAVGRLEIAPGGAPAFAWWQARGQESSFEACRRALPGLGFDDRWRHGAIALPAPAQLVDETTAAGRLVLKAPSPLRALAAARRLVAHLAPGAAGAAQRPVPGGGGPQEPLDPLWQRHGAGAAALRRLCHEDARWRQVLCAHRGVLVAELVHALRDDGAVCFVDCVRRLFAAGTCGDPACLARAHQAYRACAGDAPDADPDVAIAAALRMLAAPPAAV